MKTLTVGEVARQFGNVRDEVESEQFFGKIIMTIENFQTLIEAHSLHRPFYPFTIELIDGQRFEVDHPLALAYRDNLAFFIGPGGIPHWFDHESVSTIPGDTANRGA